MIQIPDNSTILAPATLHLSLYKEILKQKKDCLGIQVLTLSSWLSSFYHGQTKSDIEILYLYKEALKNTSLSNAFYSSKEDYDFLGACLDFIKMAKTYQIHNFPCSTQKEKDLNEILNLLYPIELKEDQTQDVLSSLPDLENVYILKKEYSQLDNYWIQVLMDHGAKWLGENQLCQTHYYSVANARKQMEVLANLIIENDYLADDIFVALNNASDESVLTQILTAHKIPFTTMQETHITSIYNEWISYLTWIKDMDLKSFINLIQTLYPSNNYLIQYYTLFPEKFLKFEPHLSIISYEENEIIDSYQFESYQGLEQQTLEWIHNHAFLFNPLDFIEIAKHIQNLHEHVSKEDLNAFNDVMSLIQDVHPHIHNANDLNILIHQIQNLSANQKANSIEGVLIGSRQDITSLRPIVFLTGTNASAFPALKLHSGIFDEAYVKSTSLPSLETRIQNQQTQIFDCLSLCETLYILYPQSDYQGKNYESSSEIENWLQTKPEFITTPDSFHWTTPNIDLNETIAKAIFFTGNHFKGSISRLESYARCPFSHALKYGMYLKEKEDITDIRIRGSILHHVLEMISKDQQDYTSLSKEEIHQYVEKEFTFAKKILLQQATWFDSQIEEITEKLVLIFEQLHSFETNWHMNIDKQEHKFSYSYPWNEYTIDLYGYIDRIDSSSTSFCIFDYKSSDKDIKIDDFEKGLSLQLATYTLAYEKESNLIPVGCFYIALRTTPETLTYGKLNYRKKVPELNVINESDILETFTKNRKLKGWHFSDASIYCDDIKQYMPVKKANPALETIKSEWSQVIDSLLEDISSGQALPNHVQDACKYCAYRSICRNLANEVEPKLRVEKEEE
ncbi:PD-(D/E)XK nuclease family protein [uncultured Holdemanella sp.]|uniref:PD-(D/E)XK nuclease family protein n=1 Tax=uncultured Holdemanella sp. TaxID=1763549 RepID=UPI002590B191|nr:PD-(D/E)XK nuclease family protein [uncultured Holdemanella sp.]